MKQERYCISIDILKTVAAVLTLLFHCNIHLGIEFWGFTRFISQCAIVMDLFFIISGYALFIGYHTKIWNAESLSTFYKRRLISIYPLYLLVIVAFCVIPVWRAPIKMMLISLPVELGLMQSWFSGMFGFSHNGGTWFLSCLAFCYAVFPVLLIMTKCTTHKIRHILLILCWLLCASIPFMIICLELPNAYSNPLLRLLEFFGGILLAAELEDRTIFQHPNRYLFGVILTGACLIVAVTRLWSVEILRNGYVTYGFVTFPLFLVLITMSISAECGYKRLLPLTKFWRFCGDHAYAVFMAQFFIWLPIRKIKESQPQMFSTYDNEKMLLLAIALCAILSVLLQDCYNKPVQRWLRKRFDK